MKGDGAKSNTLNIAITIMAAGDEVAIDTEKCVLWKQSHSDCHGCVSELGCNKYLAALLFITQPGINREKFPDFLSKILDAKTLQEINAIEERFGLSDVDVH